MGGVFISYRRDDTAPYAGRLRDRLSAVFGTDQIFRDVDRLAPGERFPDVIEQALGSCDALIVLIGEKWLSARDERDRRRLEDPRDYVRLEVGAALRREDVLVIPVLVEDAAMPDADDLPADLAPLAERNALVMSDIRWDDDMNRLVDALQRVVTPPGRKRRADKSVKAPPPTPPPPTPHPPEPAGDRGQRAARSRFPVTGAVIGGVLVLALIVVAVVALGGGGGDGGEAAESPTPIATPASTAPPGPVSIEVRADRSWTDTTLDLQPGEQLQIEAAGLIRHHDEPPLTAGPEGNPDRNLRQHNLPNLRNYDHGSLIGKVSETGNPFYVGKSFTLTAATAGRLYLGINDPGTYNNGGAWTVHIRRL